MVPAGNAGRVFSVRPVKHRRAFDFSMADPIDTKVNGYTTTCGCCNERRACVLVPQYTFTICVRCVRTLVGVIAQKARALRVGGPRRTTR